MSNILYIVFAILIALWVLKLIFKIAVKNLIFLGVIVIALIIRYM